MLVELSLNSPGKAKSGLEQRGGNGKKLTVGGNGQNLTGGGNGKKLTRDGNKQKLTRDTCEALPSQNLVTVLFLRVKRGSFFSFQQLEHLSRDTCELSPICRNSFSS